MVGPSEVLRTAKTEEGCLTLFDLAERTGGARTVLRKKLLKALRLGLSVPAYEGIENSENVAAVLDHA
jgi:hypothetical protein